MSLMAAMIFAACAQKSSVSTTLTSLPEVVTDPEDYNELNSEEQKVIVYKGTERAFTGKFHDFKGDGTYICRQCNQPLFNSSDKFDSGTGWPSFDDMIKDNVREVMDADGRRTEIVCSNCDGHLGHVFRGEGFTPKLTHHCVNSVSLDFVPTPEEQAKPKKVVNKGVVPIDEYIDGKGYEKYDVATFAGGCFWCTEAAFERIKGVVDVISGYSGGTKEYPSYELIGTGTTRHAEAIMIYYNPNKVDFNTLLEVFFVAHDPTQVDRQGPDVGPQYRSAIFYHNEAQKAAVEAFFATVREENRLDEEIATELSPYTQFWVAESYHQDYYEIHPGNPNVRSISRPKVEKVKKKFASILKDEYKDK